jgi:hypothetical protein
MTDASRREERSPSRHDERRRQAARRISHDKAAPRIGRGGQQEGKEAEVGGGDDAGDADGAGDEGRERPARAQQAQRRHGAQIRCNDLQTSARRSANIGAGEPDWGRESVNECNLMRPAGTSSAGRRLSLGRGR